MNQNVYSIHDIASAFGFSPDVVLKDLQDMIDLGYLKDAYIHQANREIVIMRRKNSYLPLPLLFRRGKNVRTGSGKNVRIWSKVGEKRKEIPRSAIPSSPREGQSGNSVKDPEKLRVESIIQLLSE
jgi:hypothetical protein